MSRVRVTRTIRIAGRSVPVKKVPRIAPIIAETLVEATAVQLRVLAQEARELVIDRLMASIPQAPGQAVIPRPERLVAPEVETTARQAPDYPPLTRGHVLHKVREGADGRFLIEWGDYINGIEVFKGEQRDGGVYYMVRPADRVHEGARPGTKPIRLTLLARVHEFGSAIHNIPPRPHWGPAANDVIAAFRSRRRTIRAAALREFLRRVS